MNTYVLVLETANINEVTEQRTHRTEILYASESIEVIATKLHQHRQTATIFQRYYMRTVPTI